MEYKTQKELAMAFREKHDMYQKRKMSKAELKDWYITIRNVEDNRLKMFDGEKIFLPGFKARLGLKRIEVFLTFEKEILSAQETKYK